MLVTRLIEIRESITEVDSKIAELSRQQPGYKSIVSIPGIGPAIAAVILASLGDPARFSNTKQVLKLAGLDLSASRSGKNAANITAKLSKKGKAELRYALYQAAVIATSRNAYLSNTFPADYRPERDKASRQRCALKWTAKMLIISWTLVEKWRNISR